MSQATQTNLRFIIPGIVAYAFVWLFCWVTTWCSLPEPRSWEEIGKGLIGLAGAFLYQMTNLRSFSNGPFHSRVNANITDLLAKPFAQTLPTAGALPWKKVRIIFYHFIDSDPSLKVQSDRIRFNGTLWTSVADFRIIALIAIGIFALVTFVPIVLPDMQFNGDRLAVTFVGLWVGVAFSYLASDILTVRHRELGEAQCDVIVAKYKPALQEKLKESVRD